MPIDEIVDVRVRLYILLCVEHQMLPVLAHIGRLFPTWPFQARVLGPVQSEPHAPSGMQGGEQHLTDLVVEDALDELEVLVRVAHAVAMRQIEDFPVYLGCLRLLVQHHATLFGQIGIGPDVVVAREVVHLDPHIGQFGDFAQEARKALRYHVAIFIPEVEHVAQQIDGSRLRLDGIEKTHQTAFLHAAMRNSQRTEVSVAKEIY